jgi:hypothetical protein
MQRSAKTNKTTLRSEWRSVLKKELTGPTSLGKAPIYAKRRLIVKK